MSNLSPLTTIFISCITSASLMSFIQFLIVRHDQKNGLLNEMNKRLKDTQDDIETMRKHVDNTFDSFCEEIYQEQMRYCRIRILTASDEIRRNVKHSEEFYDQINDDISKYNHYCRSHPGFQNNKAIHAISNINRAYEECLRNNDFL